MRTLTPFWPPHSAPEGFTVAVCPRCGQVRYISRTARKCGGCMKNPPVVTREEGRTKVA